MAHLRIDLHRLTAQARIRNRLFRVFGICALLGALLGTSGCGTHRLRMQVSLTLDANGNAPVMLSILFVKSPALSQKIMEMTARQWFAKRDQIVRDSRRDLDENYYEFVPGQQVNPLDFKVNRSVKEGILFVNYGGQSPHRYVFETSKPVQISFGSRSVTFSP